MTLYERYNEEFGSGKAEGIKQEKLEIAKNLLDILDDETISLKTGLSVQEVCELRKESSANYLKKNE